MLKHKVEVAPQHLYPTLPGKFQRSDVERVITALSSRMAISGAILRALLIMIQATRPSDWINPEVDAVCYLPQTQVAARLGITARALRYHEIRLERAGLIAKTVAADGSRGRFGGGVVQGISFRPLIEAFPGMLDLHEHFQDEERRCTVLRRRCSAAKRQLRKAIEEIITHQPKHSDLGALLGVWAAAPRRYDGLSLAELERLLLAVDEAARSALEIAKMQQDSSCVAEENFRPSIQDTTQEYSESCSGSSAIKWTARKRAEIATLSDAQSAPECQEKRIKNFDRGHKPDFLETFTPRQLYWMASDDMRMYIDAVKRGQGAPTEHDFIQAAISILPAIGVNPSVWDEAVQAMGDLAAALSVIVIDANRNHPQRPIHSPGGALRAFSRLAAVGRLNLHGSLIGLKQRREASQAD
jgi:replication initiation protein RepC